MGMRLQTVIRMVTAMALGSMLAACGEDLGVDQAGRKVTAERLEGQWLIINYWAEWCAPCRSEIPELNALSRQLGGRSASVLGVNFDGLQGAQLTAAAQALGIEFTVLAEDPAQRFGLPRPQVLPATFIVDDRGRLRERLVGEQTAAGLGERLQVLRKEE